MVWIKRNFWSGIMRAFNLIWISIFRILQIDSVRLGKKTFFIHVFIQSPAVWNLQLRSWKIEQCRLNLNVLIAIWKSIEFYSLIDCTHDPLHFFLEMFLECISVRKSSFWWFRVSQLKYYISALGKFKGSSSRLISLRILVCKCFYTSWLHIWM